MTDKDAKQKAAVARLRNLPDGSAEQVAYALELLSREHGMLIVPAALDVVAQAALPDARPVLLRVYDYYDADGTRRDSSCPIRVRVLKALTSIALAADQALAERAIATYEFLPPTRRESAESLRAAGLMLLHTLNPEAAAYAAVRLLIDQHTSRMSGEPATTAARLLAAGDHLLPLYQYVVDTHEKVSEVVAECLKGLAGAPASITDALVERYRETDDDLTLAGLFDLILGGPARTRYQSLLETFLRTTQQLDVYRYLVTALVAGHQAADLALVLDNARTEQDPRKIEMLIPALGLARGDRDVQTLIEQLRNRPPARKSR